MSVEVSLPLTVDTVGGAVGIPNKFPWAEVNYDISSYVGSNPETAMRNIAEGVGVVARGGSLAGIPNGSNPNNIAALLQTGEQVVALEQAQNNDAREDARAKAAEALATERVVHEQHAATTNDSNMLSNGFADLAKGGKWILASLFGSSESEKAQGANEAHAVEPDRTQSVAMDKPKTDLGAIALDGVGLLALGKFVTAEPPVSVATASLGTDTVAMASPYVPVPSQSMIAMA